MKSTKIFKLFGQINYNMVEKIIIADKGFEQQFHLLSPLNINIEFNKISNMDFYNLSHIFEREKEQLKELVDNETFSKIEEFLKWSELNSISLVQRIKYLQSLKSFFKHVNKKLNDITKEDVIKWLESINVSAKTRKIRYYCVKKFFEFLGSEIFKDLKIKFICRQKLPNILSEEEVKKIVELLPYFLEKVFFAVLYESGARISEFVKIKKEDVSFDEHGATILLRGKTGERRVRIRKYVGYLRQYMDFAQGDYLFNWSYGKVRKLFEKASDILGRRVYPHLLRHSRATHLAKFLTESQLKAYFGWTQDSKMTRIYIHLSGKDIDEAILKIPI
jgi:integrase